MGVKDTDKGYAKLFQRLGKSQPKLKVGVFGSLAELTHDGENETITVGALAEIFEFGLGNNPERSWLRAYVDENNSRIVAMVRKLSAEVIAGRLTPDAAMNLLGLKIVGEIQERVSQGIAPENAASTIKRKGSSTPLIDHGQFRASITHAVAPAGGTSDG